MRKINFILAVALTFAVFLSGMAFAWPENAKGRPSFAVGNDLGYFIWHDDGGWHVRVTTKGALRTFSGRIISDGNIDIQRKLMNEKRDNIVHEGTKAIVFRLFTKGGEDGFDFTTDGNSLTFQLLIDQKTAPVVLIFGGSGKVHPPTNPFTLKR